LFVSSISRGRKLWEVIFYGIITPTLCCGLWFVVFGGVALRQSRQGLELAALGTALFNNSDHFLTDGNEFCYNVPQGDITIDGEVIFSNYHPGVSPVCQYDPDSADKAIFKIFDSFHFPEQLGGQGMGPALSLLFFLGIALVFVAGSDAATLAVDSLASNGRKNYHWSRRMYWACTTGVIASILLSSDAKVYESVYTALLVCSLPIAILLCYLVQSVTLMCQAANKQGRRVADYEFPDQPEFSVPLYGGVFNAMEYLASLGMDNSARVDLGMDRATMEQAVEFAMGLCIPFHSLYRLLAVAYPSNKKANTALVATYSVCYYGAFGLFFVDGLHGITCVLFVLAGCILGAIRAGFRHQYNLRSNAIGDFVSSTVLWPQVIAQMRFQLASPVAKIHPGDGRKGDNENFGRS
jgi:BCCT, betaine/carnitine/choline family transporter